MAAFRSFGHVLRTVVLAVPLGAVLLLLGAVSLAWNAVALLLHPLLPAETGRWLGRQVISRAYRACWALASASGVLVLDADCLDSLRNERGVIFVANHPTMLDALLLVARLPRSACIMKADLMRNVFLGAGARLARYIRNDSARTMVRLAVDDLRHGGQLVIFPEGTRTVSSALNRFRPGVTLIAKRAQAPIQTVFIETDTPYLGKGWPIWRVPPLPIVVTLRLGERFAPSSDSDALMHQLERYFRHNMTSPAPEAAQECKTPRAPTLS